MWLEFVQRRQGNECRAILGPFDRSQFALLAHAPRPNQSMNEIAFNSFFRYILFLQYNKCACLIRVSRHLLRAPFIVKGAGRHIPPSLCSPPTFQRLNRQCPLVANGLLISSEPPHTIGTRWDERDPPGRKKLCFRSIWLIYRVNRKFANEGRRFQS